MGQLSEPGRGAAAGRGRDGETAPEERSADGASVAATSVVSGPATPSPSAAPASRAGSGRAETRPVKPENLQYGVDDRPPLPALALIGLQQTLLVAIYVTYVVILVRAAGISAELQRSTVSLSMVALAVGAVLQALRPGALWAAVGSGYLAPPVHSAVYLQPSLAVLGSGGLPLVFGMTIFAGLCESVLSRLLHRLRAVFPTLVSGLIMLLVGLDIGMLGVQHLVRIVDDPSPNRVVHIGVGLLTLGTMIGLSIWGRGVLRLVASMAGIALGYAVAFPAGMVTPNGIRQLAEAPLVGLPHFDQIGYAFEPALILPFLIAGLASGLRGVGVIATAQRINDVNWKRPQRRSIEGGVLADGLGCAVAGLFGSLGVSASPSAVGISQATGATSRVVAYAVGIWLVVFALMPKLAALFLAMPNAVLGGAMVFSGSMLVVGGIQIIAARPLDTRKTMIVGVSLLAALSPSVVPNFYAGLPAWTQTITGSMMSLGTIAAVLLNLLFRVGIRQRAGTAVESDARVSDLDALIAKEGKAWGVPADVVAEATETANRVVRQIEEGGLATGPLTTRVSFDDVSFGIEIDYDGKLLHLPTRAAHHTPLAAFHAEEPIVAGLASFLDGVHPDQVQATAHGTRCQIQLLFEL